MTILYTRAKPKRKRKTAKQLQDEADTKASAAALNDKWANVTKFASKNRSKVTPIATIGPPALTVPPGRSTSSHLPSKVTPGGDAAKPPDKVYTGTAMKGVATMHKSNMVPVFDDQHMVDIAAMRRNEYTKDPKKTAKDDASSTDPLPW